MTLDELMKKLEATPKKDKRKFLKTALTEWEGPPDKDVFAPSLWEAIANDT